MPDCTHLDQISVPAGRGRGLRGLPADRWSWVHLRVCRSCGHVGCCDASPSKHASAHAAASEHPIISSLEPGENWSYCYVDDLAFVA